MAQSSIDKVSINPLDPLPFRAVSGDSSTALEAAVKLLNTCWQQNKPDVVATRAALSDWLTSFSPMTRAVIGEAEWSNRINGFSVKHCPELKREVWRLGGQRAAKAHFQGHVYSANPNAVSALKSHHKFGRCTPASDLNPPIIPLSPKSAESARKSERQRDRAARGVVLAKVEISTITGDVTLLSRLPPSLQQFSSWTVKRALAWCDKNLPVARDGAKKAALLVKLIEQVQRWCGCTPDIDRTLGEQLTQDILDRVIEMKPEAREFYARSSWNAR